MSSEGCTTTEITLDYEQAIESTPTISDPEKFIKHQIKRITPPWKKVSVLTTVFTHTPVYTPLLQLL